MKLTKEQLITIKNIINNKLNENKLNVCKINNVIEIKENNNNYITFKPISNKIDYPLNSFVENISCNKAKLEIKKHEQFTAFEIKIKIYKETNIYKQYGDLKPYSKEVFNLHIGGFIGGDGTNIELFETTKIL